MTWEFDWIDPGNAGGSVRIPEFPKPVPVPKFWSCNDCTLEFSSNEKLRSHKLIEHPLKRPNLQIKGIPLIGRRLSIRRPVTLDEIYLENVDYASLNGGPMLTPSAVANAIATAKNGKIGLLLKFRNYEVPFTVEVDLLDEDVALSIEQAFFDSRVEGSLVTTLSCFNSRVSRISGGKKYIAALQAYITAIMAKDGLKGSVISRANYSEKLGEALDGLESLDRQLAEALIALISYMRNDFRAYSGDKYFPFLQQIKSVYRTGILVESTLDAENPMLSVPLDRGTETIAKFLSGSSGHRQSKTNDLRTLLGSSLVSQPDREKLILALLAAYLEAKELTLFWGLLRESEHLPAVSRYAKMYLDEPPTQFRAKRELDD